MFLSFNIPTFNRCVYLKNNIEIIILQIKLNGLLNEVEINISDNASSDKTEEIIKEIISQNQDISIRYNRNDINIGPDLNFIKAMQMARGTYSILWGDDDFLKDGALQFIYNEITTNNIGLFISNRTNIDGNGNYLGEQFFLDRNIDSRVYDFGNIDSACSYFSSVNSLGGCLSFISSIIYRTSILEEVGEYDDRFTGTYYSFLFYWWKWILRGNRIKYLATSYLFCTTVGCTNSDNFGKGVDRVAVDLVGFHKIGSLLFADKVLLNRFLLCALKNVGYQQMCYLYYKKPKSFRDKIVPYLPYYGWTNDEIALFMNFCSIKQTCKNLVKLLLFQ